ncbi:hypothetical protein KJ965_05105 [Patescibacteria group bacterium]|nr:hypothetical protein [Patescibacteria group bacterium]
MDNVTDKPTSYLMQILSQTILRGKELLRRAQVTRATFYGVMTVGWRLLTGPITAILIIAFFTPELQGFYYTFISVWALQIFVELGFSNIVTYFAGHEWAKLSLDQRGRIIGDANALSRLVSLGQSTFRWYLMGGMVVIFGVGAAGYLFFMHSPNAGVTWMAPWFALCILSGINLMLLPVWSLLEGCNQVAQIYIFRMVGAILSSSAVWAAIYLGAGLWTGSISVAVLLCWSAIFLVWRYRHFFKPFFSSPSGLRVSWWGEIWQVQWRTAMSYLSGYFTSQVFTPVLFHFHGPIVAGQFGLTWSIVMAVANFAGMWSGPRGPQFAVMIARKEYKAIDQILYRIIAVALGVLLAGGLAIWLLVYGLNILNHPFAARLLPPLPMALLLMGIVLGGVLQPTSVYLRAHKREPYMVLSIVMGIMIGLSSLILGRKFGAIGVASAYLGSIIILFPWNLAIFLNCRRKWHGNVEAG